VQEPPLVALIREVVGRLDLIQVAADAVLYLLPITLADLESHL
jgi:hypothetical protein